MAQIEKVFHHLLVPTDGSESSIAACKLAVQMAVQFEARLTLVFVVDDAVVAEMSGQSGLNTRQVQSNLEQSGQRYLDYLSRLAVDAGLEEVDQVVRQGETYREIITLASEQEADLIVIGRVESRGLRRILVGSLTERVIQHAPCSVLVIK